jgi:hypothetical protein
VRRFIEIINEAVLHDGIYSKLSKTEFTALATEMDLRGVAYNNEVFVASALDWGHVEIRYQCGIPSLYGDRENEEHIEDGTNGFDFYVTTRDRSGQRDEDWAGGTPNFDTGDLVIYAGDGCEHAMENRAFAYLVR